MRPFRQLPFRSLPDHPRIPHPWDRCEVHREELATDSFGKVLTTWHTYGRGEPLLLIHGLMTHGWSWRYVLESLGSRFQLIIPDLPGAGGSGKPDRSYHPDRLAEWIGEFADRIGIRGAKAIGNSLGGYLSLRLALRDPQALGRLVDLHSPGIPLLRLWALNIALRLPLSDDLLRWLVHRDPERWTHRNVHYYDETLKSREEARIWADPLRSVEGVRAFGRYLRDTLDPREMQGFVRALAERRDRGEPFPIPLLLVYASADPMVPPSVGTALGGLIPSAPILWMDQASHFAHVDAAERFVPLVMPFLEARSVALAHPGRGE